MNAQPVILSGGSGSRLWPLSREHYPKQLLALVSEQALIQETVTRLDGIDNSDEITVHPPVVVCNEEHRFFIAEQLRRIHHAAENIILEPEGRNTAPALTLAALSITNKDPETILLVMPADHLIRDTQAFHQAIRAGVYLAAKDYLVTFGIVPNTPETGYGYIKKGDSITLDVMAGEQPLMIYKFVEKPNEETAKAYMKSGEYLWNSGMFVFKATQWLSAIEQLQPKIYSQCKEAYQKGEDDRDFYRVNESAFKDCPSDSIDYAVMEKITVQASSTDYTAAVIPLNAGWSDVGVWSTHLECI